MMNMMRGGNRQMRRMMDKMGLDMEEIPNVQEVIIKTDKKEIIITYTNSIIHNFHKKF